VDQPYPPQEQEPDPATVRAWYDARVSFIDWIQRNGGVAWEA
jgi:hypothetical protein